MDYIDGMIDGFINDPLFRYDHVKERVARVK